MSYLPMRRAFGRPSQTVARMCGGFEKGTTAPDEGDWGALHCEDNTAAMWLSSTTLSRGRMVTQANTKPVHTVVEGDWLEADGLVWTNRECGE